MNQDFLIIDQVGVWLFEPLTEAAQKFVHDELNFDEWLWRGRCFAVGYREAGSLAEDLEDQGFTVATRH
jgi:hypothetical protein